jgi:hypothetical protein
MGCAKTPNSENPFSWFGRPVLDRENMRLRRHGQISGSSSRVLHVITSNLAEVDAAIGRPQGWRLRATAFGG